MKNGIIMYIQAFILVCCFLASPYLPFWTVGSSMLPNLHNLELHVLHRTNHVTNGDIVAVKAPNLDIIINKRIIASPGDYLKINRRKIFLNEELLNEDYLAAYTLTLGNIDIKLEDDEYFVLGDNRENSIDSRDESVGIIKKNEIYGTIGPGLITLIE